MKNIPLMTLAAALALSLGGCLQHTFNIGTGAPQGQEVYRAWHHHWLFGNIRPKHQKEIDATRFCPSGNATIHEETTFLNGLINVLIGFVYSPTTVTIRCDDGTEAQIELTEDDVARLVRDPRFPGIVEEVLPARLGEVRVALQLRREDGGSSAGVPAR